MVIAIAKDYKARTSSGFSLIEILIAMAVIALMVGIAIPNLGGGSDRYAKQEINRLLAAIEMVRDLAVIENKEYGLTIDENGYRFLVLNDEEEEQEPRWEIISERPELNEYEFPETIEFNMAIDGDNLFEKAEEEVDIFEEDVDIFEEEEEQEKVEPPQIYFLSTGEQNAFTLAIASAEDYMPDKDDPAFFRIKGTLTGELMYQGPLPGNLFNDIEDDYKDYLESE